MQNDQRLVDVNILLVMIEFVRKALYDSVTHSIEMLEIVFKCKTDSSHFRVMHTDAHAIFCFKYDGDDFFIRSWGRTYKMTHNTLKFIATSAVAVVSPIWLEIHEPFGIKKNEIIKLSEKYGLKKGNIEKELGKYVADQQNLDERQKYEELRQLAEENERELKNYM